MAVAISFSDGDLVRTATARGFDCRVIGRGRASYGVRARSPHTRSATVDRVLQDGAAYLVTGRVRAVAPLVTAPLTGRACVAYVAHARVWSRLDVAGVLVDEVYASELAAFVLDSTEGELTVDTASFAVDLPRRAVCAYPRARELEFLARRGLAHYLRSTFSDEVIVAPGDRISVAGVVSREHDHATTARGYRDVPLRMHLAGYPDRPLRIRRPV